MKYLPVFINLNLKNVLVIGAGNVAFNKIVLLLRAGANIRIISKNICTEIQFLLDQKKISWIAKEFSSLYLDNIFLVVVATNNCILNKKIFRLCNEKSLFVNVVDDQSKCSFIFPSIIDRSPITIAISSNGTAPVLLRLLREKLESIIPIRIGMVAKTAGKIRSVIKKYYVNFIDRRRFWENLFKSIFISHIMNGKIRQAMHTVRNLIKNTKVFEGEIILVGAGPGDSGLLTLRGLQVLQEADVVLYDFLVSQDVLDLIRRDAKRICVGKRAGIVTITQEQINQLLVSLAKKGKKVVRLKGGDSFIFGRGGEELEAAKNAGINIQVVPGITAAIGISSYTGIPLTHRKYAQGVIFVTGQKCIDGLSCNWSILCDSSYTLVIYMLALQATEISKKLIQYGRLSSTPIALIGQGTTINQKVVIGCLKDLEKIIQFTVRPSLLIVGDVVNLHKKLEWFYHFNKFNNISSVVNLF